MLDYLIVIGSSGCPPAARRLSRLPSAFGHAICWLDLQIDQQRVAVHHSTYSGGNGPVHPGWCAQGDQGVPSPDALAFSGNVHPPEQLIVLGEGAEIGDGAARIFPVGWCSADYPCLTHDKLKFLE